MHDYDEAIESIYIQYLSFKNQYGWALFQPISYGGFEYVEDILMFTHDFIINLFYYNIINSDFGHTLNIGVNYPEYSQPLHEDLLFLPEK